MDVGEYTEKICAKIRCRVKLQYVTKIIPFSLVGLALREICACRNFLAYFSANDAEASVLENLRSCILTGSKSVLFSSTKREKENMKNN